jgi:hypothetical protein
LIPAIGIRRHEEVAFRGKAKFDTDLTEPVRKFDIPPVLYV